MESNRTIFVTEPDLDRLTQLLDSDVARRDPASRAALEEELGRAVVVDSAEIPPDVVTMNSRVRFEDVDTGEKLDMTVVYPVNADVERGRISVLAPVGSALLGLTVGQAIQWPLPGGKARHLRVVGISYQPEAAGDDL
jgi:regulator of nucleoside diphosphate kinase